MRPSSVASSETSLRAAALRRLHEGPRPLVLGNAWDAGSAKALARAGFAAVATTSGGVAESLGYADHERAPRDEVFAATARIVRAVEVPVSADLEAGYRLAPEELARRAIEAGVAGLNLEDTDHATGTLEEVTRHGERIAALKDAARRLGVDLVVNARIDVYVHKPGPADSWLEQALDRARTYRDAGADCVYPILLDDEKAIAAIVAGVDVPVNIMLRPSAPPLARLAALGVRRVTVGTAFYRAAMAELAEQAATLRALATGLD